MSDLTLYNAKIVDQHTQQAEGYAKLTQSVGETDRRAALRHLVGRTQPRGVAWHHAGRRALGRRQTRLPRRNPQWLSPRDVSHVDRVLDQASVVNGCTAAKSTSGERREGGR